MGRSTMIMTVIASVILLGVGIIELTLGIKRSGPVRTVLMATGSILLFAFVGSLWFKIRGYDVTASHVVLRYGFSGQEILLSDISSVDVNPNALRKSIRTMANGGMWSFLGYFSSSELGDLCVYVSDPERTVVLTLPERKVVVSPGDPDAFARAVRTRKGGNG